MVAAEPGFANRVEAVFGVRKHKTMATLRRDGSPRISGIELAFAEGELTLGMMPGSVKEADLRRDPRLAIHSPTVDPPEAAPGSWAGEAKVAGAGVEMPGSGFRVDVLEVVLTRVEPGGGFLVIESWTPSSGLVRRERA